MKSITIVFVLFVMVSIVDIGSAVYGENEDDAE